MRSFFLFLLFLAFPVFSADVSFQFRDVPLPDFVRLVYSDVLKRNYVVDTDLLRSTDTLTLDLKELSQDQVSDQVKRLLQGRGFVVDDDGRVAFIRKAGQSQPEQQLFYAYRPYYRSAQYLMDAIRPFYPHKIEDKLDRDVVVFRGSAHEIVQIDRLYRELDKPSGEVLVKAVVYEVRKGSTDTNAVDLALGLINNLNGLGVTITNGADPTNAFKVRFGNGNVSALWSALSSDTRFKLVSSPTMRVKSGRSARFMAGQEVPVLSSVTYQGANNTPVQNVEYRPSGVILSITPDVRQSGSVDLAIDQQISSFIKTTNGVNDTPTLLKREIQTVVTVDADEMIVLGGLEETTHEEAEKGVSFFPEFLRGSTKSYESTEILMMLHVQSI